MAEASVTTPAAAPPMVIARNNHLEKPDLGYVLVGGRLVAYERRGRRLYELKERELCAARARIGMVFQRFNLCSGLAAALMVVKGFVAPETGQAYARARELWEQLGSPSDYLQVPYGQSLYHAYRGEVDRAQRLDADLLRLSRQRNDSAGLVLGHISSGRNLLRWWRSFP